MKNNVFFKFQKSTDKKATTTLSPNKRLRNHNNEKSNLNSRSVSTQCIADDPNFLGYKSLPSSIQHGLSEKILHKVSDKLEKLLPSSSGHNHNVNHHAERQSGFNVSKNPSQQLVDPSEENTQRSNSLSLGQTSASSHASCSRNNNGHNIVILPETGKQRVEQNECQKNPISSKKHSLASFDDKHDGSEASANCKIAKGKS